MKERLNNIELLKIIFTLCIVFNHSLGSLQMWTQGRMAVEFFFIVSGFMLFYSNYGRDRNIADFIKSKLMRFWPLMIFGTLVMLPFVSHITYEKIVAPLLFLPTTGFFEFNFIATGSVWYLCVLFWVGVFLFHLLKLENYKIVNMVLGILVFFSYIACVKYGWGKNEPIGTSGNLSYLFTQGMARGVAGMGLGYLMASWMVKTNRLLNNERKKYVAFSVCEISLLVLSVFMMFNRSVCPNNKIFIVIVFALVFGLFVIKRGAVSAFLDRLHYEKVSRYMLALFLTHQLVTDVWYREMLASSFVASWDKWMIISLFVVASCLLAFVAHHLVEVPGAKLMKKLLYSKNEYEQVCTNVQVKK